MAYGSIHLTERERQVLRLVALGRTNAEIADELGISFATAKWHVSELLSKTGVDSREQLAAHWTAERTLRRRIARALAPIPAFAPFKTAAFVGITGVATVSAIFVATAAVSSANLQPDGGRLSATASATIGSTAMEVTPTTPASSPPVSSATPGTTFMELNPTPPGSLPAVGGTPTFALTPAAAGSGRILAVFPGAAGEIDDASLTVISRNDPGNNSTACAVVSTEGLSANYQWFRMAVDGVDVTSDLTIITSQGRPQGILCYFGDAPLSPGTHTATVTVSEPGSSIIDERREWTFTTP